MNRRLFGAFGVLTVVAFGLGSCKSDPLSDLDGNPARVITDFSYLQLPIGSSQVIESSVLDARTVPLEVPITFTPCTADVTVAVDTSYHPVPATSARAIVTASAPASTCVVVSGGGVADTVDVSTVPVAFNGGISTTTPTVGDTLILTSNAQLGFDPASADIDFGDGVHGEILVRTADTLMVRVPQPDAAQPAAVTIEGVVVKYVPGLVIPLSSPPLTVSSQYAHASGGAAAFVVPADGDSTFLYDGMKTDDVDFWYPFTVASTDTLVFTLSWPGGADLDMAICNGSFTGCTGGFGAATGANPETFTVIFAPGNYNVLIEQFDTHDDPAHLFTLKIKNP